MTNVEKISIIIVDDKKFFKIRGTNAMERYEVVLEYFYEISRIPTWIFEGDRLIFCPIPKENLREEKEIGSAFEYLR